MRKRPIHILRNTLSSPLDPPMHSEKKEKRDYTSSVMIIDATRPWVWRKDFRPTRDFSPEYREEVKARWAHVL